MNIKGSGSSAINSFAGGMVSDTDALFSKNNTYYYAENARISQSGALGTLSNIEEFINKIELPADAGVFMAYFKTDEFTILVSKDNDKLHVYKYMIVDGDEKCIRVATLIDSVDSTRISNINHLSITASIESDKIQRLYIADGIHGIYSINMYVSSNSTEIDLIDLYRDSTLIGQYFGNYNQYAKYKDGSVVFYNDNFWISKVDTPDIAPIQGLKWDLIGGSTDKLASIETNNNVVSVNKILFENPNWSTDYDGEYSYGNRYAYDHICKYDNKFWRCINTKGSVSQPISGLDWEYVCDDDYRKYRVSYDNIPAGSDILSLGSDYYEYKGMWINHEYFIGETVKYWNDSTNVYDIYIASAPTVIGEPTADSEWDFLCDGNSPYTIYNISYSGSITISDIAYGYRGNYSSSDLYLSGDIALYDNDYWRCEADNIINAAPSVPLWHKIGGVNESGYSYSSEMENVTSYKLYRDQYLLGNFIGNAFDIVGYYEGDIVKYNSSYYKALVFNPDEDITNGLAWDEIINENDLLYNIKTRGVDIISGSYYKTYDIAKIEYNSSMYNQPLVEISPSNGGSLSIGKYYYVIRYTNDSGSESSDAYVSGGINATESNDFGGIIDSESGLPTSSNIGINILIKNVDDDAYGVNVYRVYYNGSGLNSKIYLIYSNKIDRVNGINVPINIFDSSDSDILDDVSDSIVFNEKTTSVSVIENKDNILFAGNINKGKNSILNYDTRAFAFDKNGVFKYRNFNDPAGSTNYEIHIGELNNDESIFGLNGKDNHDFINDDIYLRERYIDVDYRYRFDNADLDGKTFGGIGRNVSYEFVHTYLIGAKGSSIFTNNKNDNTWFSQDKFTNTYSQYGDVDINNSNSLIRDLSCRSLIDINIHRDDLVIKVGDNDREITSMSIRNQQRYSSDDSIDVVDISSFGISHHKGRLDYSNAVLADVFSGFKRNEIFRFAVKFKLDDGTYTDPMWISDVRFPANYMTGRPSYSGDESDAPDIFSFSSFVAPEDTEEGIDLLNEVIHNASGIVHNGFASLSYEDKLGSNDLSQSELLVKPLGIKFEFNNVPSNVVSAKILYEELSTIERTILGQFLVSRIGMFSNSGVQSTATDKYYESQSNGFGYPHPTPSMKYTYGIMPLRESLLSYNLGHVIHPVSFNMGVTQPTFDPYTSVANPYVASNRGSEKIWGLTDKRLSRTSAISTSPYFSDISNYMLISPEVSYLGGVYSDIVSNIGDDLVFENLVYSKNTKNGILTSTSFSSLFKTISIIGNISGSFINAYDSNSSSIFYMPFNYTDTYGDRDSRDITQYLSIGNSRMFSVIPTALFTASFISEHDRLSSVADDQYFKVSLSQCGSTLYSLLEASLWYKKDSNGYDRLGDSVFSTYYGDDYPARRVIMSATKYTEGYSNIGGKIINVNSNVDTPDINSMIASNYEPGFGLSVTNKKKAFEKMWDDESDGKIKTNIPVSIKTFMSGNGFVTDYYKTADMDTNNGIVYNSGYQLAYGSIYSQLEQINGGYDVFDSKYRLDTAMTKYSGSGSANSATFKYYKSIIPSKKYYNRNSNEFEIDEYNDSYISFFKQNTRKFDDYDMYLSNKDGVLLRDYDAMNHNPSLKHSFWDFDPIKINKVNFSGILESPTGPFDMSGAIPIPGYSGYINYSKSLSSDGFGIKTRVGDDSTPTINNSSTSLFSTVIDSSSESLSGTREFISMNSTKRGRLSGKHGAGIIVSLNDSIPMVGHMMTVDSKYDMFLNVSLSNSISKMFTYKDTNIDEYYKYVNMLNRTRAYWHMIDGACSAHTSTYIVDVRSKSNKLLSTASFYGKRNARYIESSQSINFGNSNSHKYYVFGGGTYVTMFDYTSTYGNKPEPHSSYNNDPNSFDNWNSVSNACNTSRLNLIIPIESSINTHVDSGLTMRKTGNPWQLETVVPGVNSPNSGYSSSVISIIQDADEYMYADAFSAKKEFNAIQNNYSNDDVYNTLSYKSRVIASEKKISGEQNDNWSIFKYANYIDLSPSDGSINSLITFNNRLYSLQDKAISALSVNDRSLISDSSGSGGQLLLGTGKVLDYRAIISDIYGLQKENMNAISKCMTGIYFYDSNNKSICRIASGIDNISSKSLTSEISNMISSSNYSFIFPWIKNTEILFKFDSIDYINNVNHALLFDEGKSAFESFVTSKFDFGFEFGSDIRLIKNGDLDSNSYVMAPTDRQVSDMCVYFTVNDSPQNTKIFDSIDINMSSNHASTTNSKVEIFSLYSNSIANTGNFINITSDNLSIQNKNSNIHSSIARVDGEITRMRDKYIKSMYKFIGGSEISVPYIKTNYRYSMI